MKSILPLVAVVCLLGVAVFADSKTDKNTDSPMLHKPDPKRMKDFEGCQKQAGIPTPTEDQMKKAHACMEQKKPTAPPPPNAGGDKMAFIRAQMEAHTACNEAAGIKRPSQDQMMAVHKCMAGKGYDGYH